PVRREVLPNGMVVLVQESGTADVVAMTLGVAVGSSHESPERNGVTTLLGRVLLKGTQTRSALDIARAAEDSGGAIESGTDQEHAEIAARGLARHWPTLLALVHDVATAPAPTADHIRRERDVLLAQIQGLDDQPGQVAARLLSRALYGPRGYGLPTAGTRESVGRLEGHDLLAHWERFFTPERMVLAVSGKVDAAAVRQEAGRLFGGLAPGREPRTGADSPARPVQTRDAEHRPTEQAHLLMGYLAPPIGHPDHVAAKVANAVLGGGMSGRLFRILRDEAGLAYSVGAVYPTRRGSGRIVVHIGTAPANLTAAEAGIRQVIEDLRRGPVPTEELARTQAYLTGSLALDLRTNARRAFYLAFYELMGVGPGYLERYPALIEAVTPADLQRAAERHLSEPAVVVVGPA
ncbi:MAG TPA: pitrilysin family protein, partial [Methylomirabilota bacterium]|nr:pitrilysin family protein [Methylomirabilota bacterium]